MKSIQYSVIVGALVVLLTLPAWRLLSSGRVEEEHDQIVVGCSLDYARDYMSYLADGVKGYDQSHERVEVIIMDAGLDTATQLYQVETLIARQVDAIVIKPVDRAASHSISNLFRSAGIPLVATNSAMGSESDSYVGSDHVYSGVLQMEAVADMLGGTGNVALITGDPRNRTAVDRLLGNTRAMNTYPEIRLVAQEQGNWMRDSALEIAERWLQSDLKIDAIVASNDEMAIGAAMAVSETGMDILVAGIDATPEGLQYMIDGKLSVTVFQDAYEQGYRGVETAVNLALGEQTPAYVDIPYELVSAQSVDRYLSARHGGI